MNGGSVIIVYDGDGNRVAKTVGGVTTRYLVDDRNLTGYAQVLEEVAGGTVQRVYTYGLDLISQTQPSGTSFYGYDGSGSTRHLSDDAGTLVAAYDYDAFGVILRSDGAVSNAYLFRGEYFDGNLELYFLRARYLDVSSGRFWTADTFEGFLDEPLSLHRYLYASADSVNLSDPSGEFSIGSVGVSMAINGALMSLAISVPLRALQMAMSVAGGMDLGAAAQEAAIGLITDVAVGALLGGVLSYVPRLFTLRAVGQIVQRAGNSSGISGTSRAVGRSRISSYEGCRISSRPPISRSSTASTKVWPGRSKALTRRLPAINQGRRWCHAWPDMRKSCRRLASSNRVH